MIPNFPGNLLPRPFASGGTYQVIPDEKQASGRASFKEGFPTETQEPLNSGGVAPSRPDFNGILHMLSAFAFWGQSGGQAVYKNSLDYTAPNIVFHNNVLWWCVAANGPGTPAGVRAPGSDAAYWADLLTALADMYSRSGAGGGSSAIFTPVGTVIMFHGINAPQGYLACDGRSFSASSYPKLYSVLGRTSTPDMRGLYVRGYDPGAVRDPDGGSRGFGSAQGDAMRELSGSWGPNVRLGGSASGCFAAVTTGWHRWQGGYNDEGGNGFNFAASRQVPVSTEFRGKNINLLFAIKHD